MTCHLFWFKTINQTNDDLLIWTTGKIQLDVDQIPTFSSRKFHLTMSLSKIQFENVIDEIVRTQGASTFH